MPAGDAGSRTDRDDRDLLAAVAREAAALALPLQARGVAAWQKDDDTPVSEADLAVDRFLHERLTAARPDYGWMSEESRSRPAGAGGRVFVVDPIDGTRAFLRGRDTWTVCLAVSDARGPRAGAIAHPVRGDLYSAAFDAGARRNDAPIQVAGKRRLAGAMLAGGAGVYALEPLFTALDPPAVFIGAASMALRLCLVAAGECDATVALSAKSDWDLAAGALLVHEAGGRVTDRAGTPLVLGKGIRHATVAAANPVLHAELVAVLGRRPA